MYGIFLLIEATRQLRHDFTDPRRQVADAELALVHAPAECCRPRRRRAGRS